MKRIILLLTVLFCFMIVNGISAQTQEIKMLTSLELNKPVSRMVWNGSGDVLTLVSSDRVEHVVVSDPSEPETISLADKSYTLVTVSDTGLAAALSSDRNTIYLYEPGNEKAVRIIEPGFEVLSVSVSKDGSQVLADSAEEIRTVVYDAKDGSAAYDLTGFETAAPVYDSSLSDDCSCIVWHSRGTFSVQNAADGSFGKKISLWDFASAYELSPDNSTLAVAMINDDYESGAVLFFDPQSGQELGRTLTGTRTTPYELSYSKDGSVLWAADSGMIYMIDPDSFEMKAQITVSDQASADDRISRIASSPDGQSLAVLMNSGDLFLLKQ